MVNIYKAEGGRQQALLQVFNENKIHITQTMIDKYTTDGDLLVAGFRLLIAELKNEVGSKAAEPLFQAILYYLEATRNHATKYPNSVLPCIIVLIFGESTSLILLRSIYTVQALISHLLVPHGPIPQSYKCYLLRSHVIITTLISTWKACYCGTSELSDVQFIL